MPQFNKRNKRLKRITSKQKFGVRYLHQHMFKDDATSDEDSVRDFEPSPLEKTDGRFCFVRSTSGVMIVAGVIFALVGALMERRNVDYRVNTKGGDDVPVDDAIQYNSMLDAFVLVGGVLMMLGAIMMAAVQIFLCYPRRKLGSKKPRAKDPERFLYPEKKSESEVAAKKLEKVPVFALVHKVQPKKKDPDSKKEERNIATQKHKLKTSFEQEENN